MYFMPPLLSLFPYFSIHSRGVLISANVFSSNSVVDYVNIYNIMLLYIKVLILLLLH